MQTDNTKQKKKVDKNQIMKLWHVISNTSFLDFFQESFYEKSLESDVKILLAEFRKLKQISTKRKKELEPEIRKHFLNIAERSRATRFIRWAIEFLLYTSLITIIFPMLIILALDGQFYFSIYLEKYSIFLIGVNISFGSLLVIYTSQSTSGIVKSKPDLNLVLDSTIRCYEYIVAIEGAGLLLSISRKFIYDESFKVANLVIASLVLIIGFFCFYKISRYLSNFIERKVGDYYFKTSQSMVAIRLFLFLRFLNETSSYSNATKKLYIISYIEVISRDFSNTLSTSFKTSDYQFNYWLKDNIDGVIRAIDQKKELLINSNIDTISKIEKSFANMLIWFLTDEWNKFEKIDKSQALPISWKSKLTELLKVVLSSFLPFLIVYLVQNFNVANSETINYLYITSVFWAIINLVLAVDPALTEKIRVVKDISDIFNKPK